MRRAGRSRGALAAGVLATLLAACAESASRGVVAPGGIGDPRDREALDRGDPAAFVLTTGESFEIRVPANPTTGFGWELGSSLDDSVVRKVSTTYQSSESGKVGASGTSIWKFTAVGEGRTNVVLLYRRPWEPEVAPAKIAVYSVVVD